MIKIGQELSELSWKESYKQIQTHTSETIPLSHTQFGARL